MSLGNMEQRTEGIRKQASELIEQAYQRGFKAGYSKAENDYHTKTEDDRQSSYELGLNEAWEAFKTIHKLAPYCFLDCFPNGNDELYSLSINEVIRRVREYEKKQEEDSEIRVGDEVTYTFHNGRSITPFVVFKIECLEDGGKYYTGLETSTMKCVYGGLDYVKTGRTFPEIAEVLKKLKEGEE